MKDFRGRTAIITGAGAGIGRATARALARAGANIVAADKLADRAGAVADEIIAAGGGALGLGCDVAQEENLVALRAAALEKFGRIDLLMNNAGFVVSGGFMDIEPSHWRKTFEVNLFAAVRAVQLMLPDIEKNGEGHIVNVASTAALYPYNTDRMPYNASKLALMSFSEALAMEVAARNIGVTLLLPGPVKTRIGEQIVTLTPGLALTPPPLPVLEPEQVAETLLDAIRDGRFFVPSHGEVHAIYREHGADPDGFLRRATERHLKAR